MKDKIYLILGILFFLIGVGIYVAGDVTKDIENNIKNSELMVLNTSLDEYQLVNDYRFKRGKGFIKRNVALEQSANIRAYRLSIGQDTWSHDGFKGVVYHFYDGNRVGTGENLARGFTSFKDAFEAWKVSDGHNRNMLGEYCDIGLGNYGDVYVMHLGIDYDNDCNK